SYDMTMRLWDSFTGKLVAGPLRRHNASVRALSFSPDGARFVSGAEDGTIRVWDMHDYQITGPFRGHTSSIIAVAYFPDGKHVVSALFDESIRIWDVRTGALAKELLRGHNDAIDSISISFDGKKLASGAY
ncbi:hypothetical protein HYDPIDRAFT_72420, partial [Hydnomerulius pinastri MD-312]